MAGFTTRPVVMGTRRGWSLQATARPPCSGFEVLDLGLAMRFATAGVAAVFALTLLKPYEVGMGGERPIPTSRGRPAGPGLTPSPSAAKGSPRGGRPSSGSATGASTPSRARGLLPATVPATFGALVTVLTRDTGTLGLRETLGPVVELARTGYPRIRPWAPYVLGQQTAYAFDGGKRPTTGAVL